MFNIKKPVVSITCNHSKDKLIFIRNATHDEIRKHVNWRSIWFCNNCHSIIYKNYTHEIDTGNISDGYHTFNELYHHRAILTSVIVNQNKERCWKSLKHHNGTMYDGMFIVGIETPKGCATYHYDVNPYWFIFNCKELPMAPEWDGHTPNEAIQRIASLNKLGKINNYINLKNSDMKKSKEDTPQSSILHKKSKGFLKLFFKY